MVGFSHKRQQGFTLVELMIVVAIMGIMAAIAYPSMQKQTAQMRLKDAVNLADSAFKQARSDALVMRADVNTTLDTSAKTLKLTQIQNSITKDDIKSFNSKITITPINSMPTEITFTPTKRALKKSDNTPLKAEDPANPATLIGYEFCYQGVSTEKYVVTIDALTNVKVTQNGVCS